MTWMQTYTGEAFDPINPDPRLINIFDIAAALSKMCRYNGHCKVFYSVAEHSVLMARQAPRELMKTALLHDASEAYIADITRPVKPYLPDYHVLEVRLERAIASSFGLPYPWPAEIKRLDNAILADEAEQIMGAPPRSWGLTEPPLGITVHGWDPVEAEEQFLRMWGFANARG